MSRVKGDQKCSAIKQRQFFHFVTMTLKVLNVTTLISTKSLNNSKLVTFKMRLKKRLGQWWCICAATPQHSRFDRRNSNKSCFGDVKSLFCSQRTKFSDKQVALTPLKAQPLKQSVKNTSLLRVIVRSLKEKKKKISWSLTHKNAERLWMQPPRESSAQRPTNKTEKLAWE